MVYLSDVESPIFFISFITKMTKNPKQRVQFEPIHKNNVPWRYPTLSSFEAAASKYNLILKSNKFANMNMLCDMIDQLKKEKKDVIDDFYSYTQEFLSSSQLQY